jgi:hypothetical protein
MRREAAVAQDFVEELVRKRAASLAVGGRPAIDDRCRSSSAFSSVGVRSR